MRKSKYDNIMTQLQESEKECPETGQDIDDIEKKMELPENVINLSEQIETVKELIQELNSIKSSTEESIKTYKESVEILNSALQDYEVIANNIYQTIKRAANSTISVKLSQKDNEILTSHRKTIINEEKELFNRHVTEMRILHESHWKEVKECMKSNSSFTLNGWPAKYSLIAFWILYAYFCITLIGFILYKT